MSNTLTGQRWKSHDGERQAKGEAAIPRDIFTREIQASGLQPWQNPS